VVAWLGADSVRRALLDASRAEDLEAANRRNAAQAQELALQRQRLQLGIQELQLVHSAVARGHWEARARINEGELLPVAMSLNLLLDRLTRLSREQDQRMRIEAAAQQLAMALRRTRAGEPYMPPAYTGTIFDEVLVEIAALRPAIASGGPTSRVAEDQVPFSGVPASQAGRSLDPAHGLGPNGLGANSFGANALNGDEPWPSLNGNDLGENGLDYLPDWLRPGNT
jgi:hypothetical protein